MDISKFLISEQAPLREALQRISDNQKGIVMVTDHNGSVVGLGTDGDIRSRLLEGATLEDSIGSLVNRNFIWANQTTPRELLLKELDRSIRVIPILDQNRRLVSIVSRDQLPIQAEEKVYARARSPVRISFGGGGSDLTHFFSGDNGAVINTTISLYSHATLRIRSDKKIAIYSRDLKEELHAENLSEALKQKGNFGLVQALLKAVHPEFGFELYLNSDFPMNSGLGGSSVVASAILGCFNQFRQDKWDVHDLAELAFQAERLYFNISGGWQDQYATVFGGFNFMEFRMDQNIVHTLRINQEIFVELEESLVLCDTGVSHNSGNIHQDQKIQMQQAEIQQQVKANVELTYKIRDYLLRGKLLQFGQALNEAWVLKRKFSSKISNSKLDAIYAYALENGAVGGKLLGAGGGGFFIFYANPFRKHTLIDSLENKGLKVCPFRFDQDGLRSWTVRESKNSVSI